jgi:hypothetical protein
MTLFIQSSFADSDFAGRGRAQTAWERWRTCSLTPERPHFPGKHVENVLSLGVAQCCTGQYPITIEIRLAKEPAHSRAVLICCDIGFVHDATLS